MAKKGYSLKLSANVDPNVVGAIVVVVVIGFVAFYAWLDIRKRPHHSTSFSPRHEPSGYRCKNCGASTYRIDDGVFKCDHCGHIGYINSEPVHEPQHESDPYEEGFERELGRQAAIKEAMEQRKRDAERKRMNPGYVYDPPKYDVRDPLADFVDDAEYARKKRKKDYW